jgi:hypothetical protein
MLALPHELGIGVIEAFGGFFTTIVCIGDVTAPQELVIVTVVE